MKLSHAIDAFIADMRREGRINSRHTELAYRAKLDVHANDVGNRDPAKTGRADVKKTLLRWEHPNSQRQAHAILSSFYRWCMQEGIRETNPADQVRRAKAREVSVFRPTREEAARLMEAGTALGRRERWFVHLGVCAGLRSQEIRGLQERHLARAGAVWVSADIAKRQKERWIPVFAELQPVVDEIVTLVGHADYVIPSRRAAAPAFNERQIERAQTPISAAGLYKMAGRIGERAGIPARVTPHTFRHAFGHHVERYAGVRAAQALLGHASIATTAASYSDLPTLDELAVSVSGFQYRQLSVVQDPQTPHGRPNAR